MVNGANLFLGCKGNRNGNLNVSPIGLAEGVTHGWTTSAYVYQTNIGHLLV